jgi:hypothetical protein
MEISELITKLKAFPPHAEVIIRKIVDQKNIYEYEDYGTITNIQNVLFDAKDKIIYPPSLLFTKKTSKRMLVSVILITD